MNIYPDVLGGTISGQPGVKAQIPFTESENYGTVVTKFDSNVELRRQKILYPTSNFQIEYRHLYPEDFEILRQSFNANYGGFQKMSFYHPHELDVNNLYSGMIMKNSTLHHLKLPSKGRTAGKISFSTGETVDVNADEHNDGGSIYIHSGFLPKGTRVYWSFSGRKKSEVVFDSDALESSEVKGQWYSVSVSLRGLVPITTSYHQESG